MFFQSGPIQVFQVSGFGQGRKIPGLGGGAPQFLGGSGGAEPPRGHNIPREYGVHGCKIFSEDLFQIFGMTHKWIWI